MKTWQLSNIPDLSGKKAIITGGNVGLGFKSALELARKGAAVVIACRRMESGIDAIQRIQQQLPQAEVECIPMDLTDTASIAAFSTAYQERYERLDILLNNAGVVNLEHHQLTKEGHEMHMATNHYGHFILTGHLFKRLCQTEGARVVTVTSGAYRAGEIQFDDLNWQQRTYSRVNAYGDSKLANVLFMHALQTRFDRAGANALSVAAHPGLTATERQQTIGIGGILAKWLASPVSTGVAPQLRAATDPSVRKCTLYGPKYGIRGAATPIEIKPKAKNNTLAEKLWCSTEKATGYRFP